MKKLNIIIYKHLLKCVKETNGLNRNMNNTEYKHAMRLRCALYDLLEDRDCSLRFNI